MRASPETRRLPKPTAEDSLRLAFEQAFTREYGALCDAATRYMRDRDAAEEIVQDLFLHLWDVAAQEGNADRVLARVYLFTAVRNRCLGRIRHRRVAALWAARTGAVAEQVTATVSDDYDSRERIRAVARALEQLPPRAREIFELSRSQGLSYREIAEVLGVSLNTVETQMWRALKRLRTHLTPFLGVALTLVGHTLSR